VPTRYALATAIVAAAFAIRWAVLPLQAGLAYLTFYPAMLLAFLLCGTGPGWFGAVLAALAGYGIFTPSHGTPNPGRDGLIALGVFLLSAQGASWVVRELQRSLTQLQRSLRDVQAVQRQLQAVLDDQTDVIIRFDAQNTILFVNQACCDYFDFRREDVIGTRWAPLVLPEDLPAVIAGVAALNAAQPTMRIENRVQLRSGEVRWMEWANHVTVFDDGRPAEYQGSGRDISVRKRLEDELRATRDELEDLYQHSPIGYHSLDAQGRFVRINDTELGWLGCSRDELIGRRSAAEFFSEDSQAVLSSRMPRFIDGTEPEFRAELDLIGAHGVARRVSVRATRALDAQGRFLHTRSVLFDLTDVYRLRVELQRLSREQHAMLDNDLVGILKVRDRRVVWKNRGLERLTGYGHEELIGQPTRLFYPSDAGHAATGAAIRADFAAGRPHNSVTALRRKGGESLWVRMRGDVLPDGDDESIWVVVDVSESQRRQRATEQLAFHDALTQLPNRLLLADRLGQALNAAARDQQRVAVCFIDVDGFKQVNDQQGHGVGDAVLCEVAARLQRAVRLHDTVARVGGDEFVVVLTQLHHADEHQAIVARMRDAVAAPIDLTPGRAGDWTVGAAPGAIRTQVGASIGVAVYPEEAGDADSLMRLADTGMYRIKANERSDAGLTPAR
ncbi:MAG: diguanylate cyclase, partial [Leptothrix sp. (in: b-proteobacteria)]